MLHRAKWMIWGSAGWMMWAMGSQALMAQSRWVSNVDPDAGFEVVTTIRNSDGGRFDAKLADILTQGAKEYRRAAFMVAVDWYDDALQLAPDIEDVKALHRMAVEMRHLQREAQKTLPRTPSQRDKSFKERYNQARTLYKQKQYQKAFESFYSLWLVAGDYKDTLGLMEKSKKKGAFDPVKVFDAMFGPEPTPEAKMVEAIPDSQPERSSALILPSLSDRPAIVLPPASAPEFEDRTPEPRDELAEPRSISNETQFLIQTAYQYLDRGENEAAKHLFEQILALDQEDEQAREGLRKVQESGPSGSQVPQDPKLKIDELILQAQFEKQAGNLEASRSLYEQALGLDSESLVVQRGLHLVEKEIEAAKTVEETSETATQVTAAKTQNPHQTPPAIVTVKKREAEEPPAQPWDEREDRDIVARENLAVYQQVKKELNTEPDAVRSSIPVEAAFQTEPEIREAPTGFAIADRGDKRRRELEIQNQMERDLETARQSIEIGELDQARSMLQYIIQQDPDFERASSELKRLDMLDRTAREESRKEREIAVAEPLPATESPLTGTVVLPAMAGDLEAESRVVQAAETIFDSAPAMQGDVTGATIESSHGTETKLIPVLEDQIAYTQSTSASPASREIAQIENAPPPANQTYPLTSQPETSPNQPVAVAATPDENGPEQKQAKLNKLYELGLRQYKEGKLETARKAWSEMLTIQPGEKRATEWLESTQAEYEQYLADLGAQQQSAELAKKRKELLNSSVTIDTVRPTPLSEFIRLLSYSTVHNLEYSIADGAEADIFANFVDKPLRDVLDDVLKVRGLTWEINEKNVIIIKTDLKSQTFNLTTSQVAQVRSLLDAGVLQEAIWGQREPPAKGVEMTLDERFGFMLVVGSRLHLEKVHNFLDTMEIEDTPALETKIYRIREEDGPRIKALINSMISAERTTPFEAERKIIIDGRDMFIHDTPENLAKIEQLLLDNKFMEDLRSDTLQLANFSLIPRDVENRGADYVAAFTGRVVEAIRTFLYARTGEEAANSEGRILLYDRATFQLTLVDTPTNINRIGEFINSLPELRQRRREEVIFLDFAIAEELAASLAQILDLEGAALPGGAGGASVVRRMRRGEQFEFEGLRIRLVRVEDGDPNDRNDDEAEINIISGTQSNQVTLRELDTVFFEDFEITAEDVQPSGGGGGGRGGGSGNQTRRGEGTARILIRRIQPATGPGEAGTLTPAAQTGAAETSGQGEGAGSDSDQALTITPFGQLNALIIRYDNPANLTKVKDLIKELDLPTKQVEVETKFVQVDEQRAREFSADFTLDGFANNRSFDPGFYQLGGRFAQPTDELRDTFEPPLEQTFNSNLLKGATIINAVLGTGAPGISFQLRMLEAEGILNIVNGPKVVALDNVQADFRVERIGPFGSGQGGGQQVIGQNNQAVDPFGQGSGGTQDFLRNEDASQFQSRVTSVILLVQPQITSPKSIIFNLDVEILDFDTDTGVAFFPGGGQQAGGGGQQLIQPLIIDPNRTLTGTVEDPTNPGQFINTGPGPFVASSINNFQLMRSRKAIITTARTEDGGTIILGGWTGERSQDLNAGVPILRNMPYIGKLFFEREQRTVTRTTLLVFLTANLID